MIHLQFQAYEILLSVPWVLAVKKLENEFPPRELKAFLVTLYKVAGIGNAKGAPNIGAFIFLRRAELRKDRILL